MTIHTTATETQIIPTEAPEVEVTGCTADGWAVRIDSVIVHFPHHPVTEGVTLDDMIQIFPPATAAEITEALADYALDEGVCDDHPWIQMCGYCLDVHGRPTCHHDDHEDYCPGE